MKITNEQARSGFIGGTTDASYRVMVYSLDDDSDRTLVGYWTERAEAMAAGAEAASPYSPPYRVGLDYSVEPVARGRVPITENGAEVIRAREACDLARAGFPHREAPVTAPA